MIPLVLGRGQIHTNPLGYTKLVEFYEKCLKFRGQEILIDFDEIRWIDANMAALVIAILRRLESTNKLKFIVDADVIKEKFHILIRNGLVSGIEFVPRGVGTEVKLTGFNANDDAKFINYIENDLLANYNLINLKSKDKGELVDSFLEIFGNVQKHAKTTLPLFACGQYFPALRKLNFTLVDLGVGYLSPIRKHTNGAIDNSSDAILWALSGNTTKKGVPGGLGLKGIHQFCDRNGARFEIITGNSYWNNKNPAITVVTEFCGTTVNIIFDCSI